MTLETVLSYSMNDSLLSSELIPTLSSEMFCREGLRLDSSAHVGELPCRNYEFFTAVKAAQFSKALHYSGAQGPGGKKSF